MRSDLHVTCNLCTAHPIFKKKQMSRDLSSILKYWLSIFVILRHQADFCGEVNTSKHPKRQLSIQQYCSRGGQI